MVKVIMDVSALKDQKKGIVLQSQVCLSPSLHPPTHIVWHCVAIKAHCAYLRLVKSGIGEVCLGCLSVLEWGTQEALRR